MQTQVARLRQVLALLEPAVSRKGTLKALSYVRLGEGKAVATDLEVAIEVDMPEATDGVCLLPFATAENFLRFTPGSLTLGIVSREDRVHLLAQGSQASFPTMEAEEYPPLPKVGDGALSAVVDGDDLVKALASVAEYTTTEQSRPVLTAVCLTLGAAMEAAAADGFRLAVRPLRAGFPGGKGQQALVPSKAVKVMEHLWKLAPSGAETDVDLSIAELVVSRRPVRLDYDAKNSLLQLGFGEVALMVKLVGGTFPNYPQLVPTTYIGRVTFYAQELLRAVRQVQQVAHEGKGIVRLQWEGDRLTVVAKAEDVGEIEVALKATVEAPGRIAFNVGYLVDYLKGKEGPMDLSISEPTAPGVFTHRETKVVVMPMFLKGEEPPKAQSTQEQAKAEEAPGGEAERGPEPVEGAPAEEAASEATAAEAQSEDPKPKRKGRRKKQE